MATILLRYQNLTLYKMETENMCPQMCTYIFSQPFIMFMVLQYVLP